MIGHQKQVNHVTFSPDGLLIASAGFDNHTKIWNARDGTFINTLRGHVAPVYQCCFSADSRLLVTASKDTTLMSDTQTCKRYCPPPLSLLSKYQRTILTLLMHSLTTQRESYRPWEMFKILSAEHLQACGSDLLCSIHPSTRVRYLL